MHEFYLMANLRHKIEEIAQQQKADNILVARVNLRALSPITPFHFREHFETFVQGTVAEGAQLEVTQLTS